MTRLRQTTPSGFCVRITPDAGAREGVRMRLVASAGNMHSIEDASGRVI
jgi:hypothetical protein